MSPDAGTLLLTRSEVAAVLDPRELLAALRDAFVARTAEPGGEGLRVPLALPPDVAPPGASGMVLAPGLVPGIPAWSVKSHGKVPGGDPAIRGVLVIHDMATGAPLTILESTGLTALRTGLAGALGADALARRDAQAVAIVGAGAQGRAQLAALRLVRAISQVRVFDPAPRAAARFALNPCCEGLQVEPAATLEAALEGADIVVAATWAREPFLFARHLRPGLHVTTLGPDQPGKCEVAACALRAARVVVDDRALAVAMGAVGGAGLGPEVVQAELGEVLAGTRPGREAPGDVTVLGAVGLAFQDLAAGWLALRRATERGIGRRIDLLA